MKLLIDANLSPKLLSALDEAGHDALHVRDVGLLHAADREILEWCDEHERVVITADADFPMLLAVRGGSSPSVVLLRGVTELTPDAHADLLVRNLPLVADDLARGAIVTITSTRLRVRDLPIR